MNNVNDLNNEWSELYGRPLSVEETREIDDAVYEYFRILKRWNDKVTKDNEQTPANNN